jgi:acid phosphatase type 7
VIASISDRRARTGVLAAVCLVAAGCGDGSSGVAPTQPATVVAVGDIACGADPMGSGGECRYGSVAEVVIDEQPDLFLALGDAQYVTPSGDLDFSFYDRSFGELRPITLPAAGDEDWDADRDAFLGYFGARTTATGYDSTVVAGWHVVVLNSRDCFDADGCREGSPQYEWLQERLADPPDDASECTLAIWHDPRFLWAAWWSKDGVPRGAQERVAPFWELLDAAGADVVLNGNAHHYERWAPMDAEGDASPEGITEFVVGTGGKSLNDLGLEPRPANLAVAQDDEFGVLVLELRTDGLEYRWRGIEPGGFSDQGSIVCH